MNENTEIFEDVSNPLDSVEDVLTGQQWEFSRPNPEELRVQISGKRCVYSLTFLWQEEFSAMQFFCELDLGIPKERLELAGRALHRINESLWLGHFDIPSQTGAPCFRHTSLFRGWTHSSGADHVEDLVDIALAECERFYNTFSLLAGSSYLTDDFLALALCDGAGEA